MKIQKNHHYRGEVVDLTSQGQGVVKIEGFPLFVPGTIPGEKIELRVVHLRKNFGYGRLVEIIEPVESRVEIIDEIGGRTGTMPLQHIKYSDQLLYKRDQVISALERIGHIEAPEVHPTIGMVNPWGYRNKAQVPVREVDGRLEIGYFRPGSNKLVPMENFPVEQEAISRGLITIRDILRDEKMTAYDPKSHTGQVRHIIVKRGLYTGQIMVILVLNDDRSDLSNVVERIEDSVDNVVSIYKSVNNKRTNVILGEKIELLSGQKYYEDQVLGKTFRIGGESFFQVNTQGAEQLYYQSIKLAGLKSTDTVLDAYSGIGTVGISVADQVKEVYGIEIVEEAVKMADKNCEINNVKNATYIVGKAEEKMAQLKKDGVYFDVAFVDPPRKGLEEKFIKALVENSPEKIVYISCNPATQARDIKLFVELGYKYEKSQPVDMFPQTSNVENVGLLTRK